MKIKARKYSLVVAVALPLVLVLTLLSMANAQGPVTAGKAGPKTWSALDKVDTFVRTVTKAGFTWQEGKFEYLDTIKECCEGRIPDALGNNPFPNAYLALRMPQPPGVNAVLPVAWNWQLREDEAMVLIGQTPPPAAYFNYQTWVAFLPGDLTRPPVPGLAPIATAKQMTGTRRSIAIGDATNNATIRTIGADRANQPIVYIVTGNRTTEQRVRAAVRAAGYPDSIINVETISQVIAPLGLGDGKGSIFFMAQRVAVPESRDALKEYLKNPPYRAFRVTPKVQLAPNPEPVPVLRVRGTGHTEMELYPALKRLRQAIVDKEMRDHANLNMKEMDSRIWQAVLPTGQIEMLEKPWAGLQRNQYLWAATRDTNYIQTAPYFRLREGTDEYVIVYGVNHQKTGKATYINVSVYGEPNQAPDGGREFGLATMSNDATDFDKSARQYLPDDPQAGLLYALKVARNCNGEKFCIEVKQPSQTDIYDVSYDCDPPIDLNNADMYIVFRGYMEPATKVGPDENELLWDRGIYFGHYFDK